MSKETFEQKLKQLSQHVQENITTCRQLIAEAAEVQEASALGVVLRNLGDALHWIEETFRTMHPMTHWIVEVSSPDDRLLLSFYEENDEQKAEQLARVCAEKQGMKREKTPLYVKLWRVSDKKDGVYPLGEERLSLW
jgi:signal transduction histidine kinase